MMNEEDEAFNEIERRSKVKQTLVKAQLDKPQRTWVGLTDEEVERLIHNFGADLWTLLDEVDARLKARNA
jgi:hypothetical protein